MIKIICVFILLILFPKNVFAIHEVIDARCTTMVKSALREEAKNFNYRLSKNNTSNEVVYTSYFYGLSDNIDLTDENGNKYNRVSLNNLKQGSTLTINLYASTNSYCNGYKIATRIIKIPYYNPYYGTDYCKGYENLSLCSENERVLYDETEFVKRIKEYSETHKSDDKNDIIDDDKIDNTQSIIDYILQYKYYFLGGVFLVGSVILIIIIIKKTKNRGIL